MLTFPLAMASSGIIPGIFTCIFCGFVAGLGLFYLSRCASKVRPQRSASFYSVAQLAFPAASLFFDLAIAIKCFGVSISYLIIIKGLMPSATKAVFHAMNWGVVPPVLASGRFWVTLITGMLVPLCFLRKLDSLRHTSYVALFSVVYLLLVVIVCYFKPPPGSVPPGEIHLIKLEKDFISTFPVQVFAFTCAQNLFPIYNELHTNTQPRLNLVIGTAVGGATVIYEIIAIFGYLTFGSHVGANIIAMYPETTLFVAVGQVAIVVLVLFSYPLQVLPCRNSLDKVWDDADKVVHKVDRAIEGEEDGGIEPLPIQVHDAHDPSQMGLMKHILLTCIIIAGGFSIAFFVDDLQLVLSFVGSTGSTTISFILPGLLYFQLFRRDRDSTPLLKWGALALAIYGTFILIFCLSFNIYKVVSSS
ncbi:hypothetical protein DACRYDRAFT_64373 [Dacryopinax primogenitus]|uniref:Amino acid transporter transmembrane domain-containing protein n=1 Tax=Dacryopinax primogenitus (strain DJM 731) TaxID=1858805 RepID=M5G5F3_DACPD|nr:uncharacterized protein DACRYDRAFT_64373 [Dacryopinax primogenitus]EJU03460.1 hypothetical protein DACRYDRAFT_64373 [Dacryopinax primogenitus]